jgi:dTDP-glucose pyrophosphorylase
MYEKHIIEDRVTVLEALGRLNDLSGGTLVLFVVNDDGRMVGTLTDGDIRRYLLGGGRLDDNVRLAMKRDYIFVRGSISLEQVRSCRKERINLVPCLDDEGRICSVYDFNTHKSFLPLDAVLMAGGKGERMRPLTLETPKPLLPVGGKAIIDYNVERLIANGVEDIYVTVNYLHEQIETHFSQPVQNVTVHCVQEPEFLGTIGSIKYIPEFRNDTVLLMNSDLFTNIDFEDFYSHFVQYDADMSVATFPFAVNIPYGIFELEGREIRGIKEKPLYNYHANAGIYLLRKEVLDMIPSGVPYHATDLIEALVAAGKRVIRFPITGYWIDIGKPEDYRKAEELVKHLKF